MGQQIQITTWQGRQLDYDIHGKRRGAAPPALAARSTSSTPTTTKTNVAKSHLQAPDRHLQEHPDALRARRTPEHRSHQYLQAIVCGIAVKWTRLSRQCFARFKLRV